MSRVSCFLPVNPNSGPCEGLRGSALDTVQVLTHRGCWHEGLEARLLTHAALTLSHTSQLPHLTDVTQVQDIKCRTLFYILLSDVPEHILAQRISIIGLRTRRQSIQFQLMLVQTGMLVLTADLNPARLLMQAAEHAFPVLLQLCNFKREQTSASEIRQHSVSGHVDRCPC